MGAREWLVSQPMDRSLRQDELQTCIEFLFLFLRIARFTGPQSDACAGINSGADSFVINSYQYHLLEFARTCSNTAFIHVSPSLIYLLREMQSQLARLLMSWPQSRHRD